MNEEAPHIIGANGRPRRIQYSVNEVIKHNLRRSVSTANGSERGLCRKPLATIRGTDPGKYQKAWLTPYSMQIEVEFDKFSRSDGRAFERSRGKTNHPHCLYCSPGQPVGQAASRTNSGDESFSGESRII
jgi:hypothetical protein